MGAMAALARSELRRTWRAVLAIGLIAGLVGGGVLCALAGARRTDSAFDRLVARTDFWDIELTLFDPGDDVVERIRSEPGVAQSWVGTLAVGRDLRDPEGVAFFPVTSSTETPLVDRIIVAGRAPDPDADDEVLVAERVASLIGLEIGDTLPWAALSHEQFVAIDEVGHEPAAGPRVDLEVVGFTVDPADVTFAETPTITGTPAFARRFGPDLPRVRVVHLAVDDGVDPGAVAEQASAIAEAGAPDSADDRYPAVTVHLLTDARRAIEAATDLPEQGLRVVAAVAAAVAVFALLQAAARQLGVAREATRGVRALGVTRMQRSGALALAWLPAGGLAALTAAGVAIAASSWTPVGAARRAEPDPGVFVDGWVIGVGAVLVGATVALSFAATAFVAGRRAVGGDRFAREHPRLAPGWLGLHPVAGLGARLAFDGGGVVPVRSAMAGVALGTITICGGLVFGASLDRLDDPSHYGHPDVSVEAPTDELVGRVRADDAVAGATVANSAEVQLDGVPVSAYGFGPLEGTLGFTLLEGRQPATDTEVVVGPGLLERLDVEVGDIVHAAPREGDDPVALRVVGVGLGPGDLFGSFADMAALTIGGHDLVRQTDPFSSLHVDLVDGATLADVDPVLDGFERNVADEPPAVANLVALEKIPLAFIVLGTLVALTAIGHAVALTVRYRSRELATARALGCTAGQSRGAILFAAGVLAAFGLVFGLPIGLNIGRRLWEAAAATANLATEWVTPAWVAGVAPAMLVGAVAVALVPATRSTRSQGEALRT
jgi:hypothetical protein